MPQISKEGKFVFGWSIISELNKVQLPEQAVNEYSINNIDKLIFIYHLSCHLFYCIM